MPQPARFMEAQGYQIAGTRTSGRRPRTGSGQPTRIPLG